MFFVFERQPPNTADYKSSVLLIKDHWDDWFKYETQFFMSYVDMMGESHDIGAVKIGQENMEKGQRSPALPVQFNQLPADCFSLGQSDFYYENINHLGDGIREQILTNMRDLAYDPDLYAVVRNQEVTRISLMRDVTHFMITHQYQRIAKGNARLTNYEIEYTYPVVEGLCETKLNFNIVPDSNPPTNIHVVIGRNNVGKTYLIKNILLRFILSMTVLIMVYCVQPMILQGDWCELESRCLPMCFVFLLVHLTIILIFCIVYQIKKLCRLPI